MTSKRRKWVIVLAIAALAITSIVPFPSDDGPSYRGRSLRAWLFVYQENPLSTSVEKEADEAIRHYGTNALPYVLKWIQYEQPSKFRRAGSRTNRPRSPYYRPTSIAPRLASLFLIS
jgi:hypothetical protein